MAPFIRFEGVQAGPRVTKKAPSRSMLIVVKKPPYSECNMQMADEGKLRPAKCEVGDLDSTRCVAKWQASVRQWHQDSMARID